MPFTSLKGVEIFATGRFHPETADECVFTSQDLKDIVRNYVALSSGPRPRLRPYVKIGKFDPHKGPAIQFEEGSPAAAWVKNLAIAGSILKADFEDMQAAVADWIDKKLYTTVSAEIDRPAPGDLHPEFRTRGAVLRAVSLLGADPPAVKNLRPIQLAERVHAGGNIFARIREQVRAEHAKKQRPRDGKTLEEKLGMQLPAALR